ncbi:hypothetical protein SDRG_12581 [Saprolegnia diclina VS20]|uniref:FUZ/MON1/HPS1 first Longin domain-containing protein n=1 Tax=Saprolegnia diclina (strain VS20) TaxID=1156394 RepID=T0RIC1_SAPDV|nr:hypothetical protein SDRG_12581 [Saprolegnia diclina VS20]EQC29572.1 hypothetical protein SDRG_12581 [Saprolegnia diclina VS20]|eukprot:XP_008616876.1 hypothetical protein SDRG_12581 [Saprolegnia diclina VS20]
MVVEDGLLVVVNGIGIPVLIRAYGDVLVPPNAAVSVVSALFHATLDSKLVLASVASPAYAITYRHLPASGVLLAFFHRRACIDALLLWLEHCLCLLLGPTLLMSTDAGALKFELARSHVVESLDWLVAHRADMDLALGLPLSTPGDIACLDDILTWASDMYVLSNGVVVGDRGDVRSTLTRHEMVLCVILAKQFALQCKDRHVQHTVYTAGAQKRQIVLVRVAPNVAWFGLAGNSVPNAVVQSTVVDKLSLWCSCTDVNRLARSTLALENALVGPLLGYCAGRLQPSSRHSSYVYFGAQDDADLRLLRPDDTTFPHSRDHVRLLLQQHYQHRLNDGGASHDDVVQLAHLALVYAVRAPLHFVCIFYADASTNRLDQVLAATDNFLNVLLSH